MFCAVLALSTSLGAQSRGSWATGLAATLGSGWQLQGLDFALVRPVEKGPFAAYSFGARAGSFVDETQILGNARGFLGALTFAVRSKAATIGEVGTEMDVSRVGFDLTLEVAGYAASNSPLPEGSAWVSAALLPGVRFGREEAMQGALMVGPAAFIGRETHVRAFLNLRVEIPLAPR
jgi:hypothetical protein